MTFPAIQQDDEDSLYDHPLTKSPITAPTETVLPHHQAIQIDDILDSEETPPPSRNSINSLPSSTASSSVEPLSRGSSPRAPTPTSASHHDEDDRFDSDENQISTSSSSASSSTTIPERPSRDEVPAPLKPSTHHKPVPSFLSRASATFYKAFRKKKPPTTAPPPASDDAHAALEKLFDAQIATLRSARTGFVDLALVTPMTQRTLDGVAQAAALLQEFSAMERRVATLRREAELSGRQAEGEIRAKEVLLVDAKIRLAEVSEEVERLRHDLRRVQRVLADPQRLDRRRVKEVRKEVGVCREARRDVEKRLREKTRELDDETLRLQSAEKDFRDIEGDWA